MKTSSPANDTATLNVGETFENHAWRIQRFEHTVRATSLIGAGKRGARVAQISMCGISEGHPLEKFLSNLIGYATKGDSVEGITALIKAEAKAQEFAFEYYLLRGVDVVPGGFKTIHILGDFVSLTAEFATFSVRDLTDKANETTFIPCPGKNNKKAIRAFYVWAQVHTAEIKAMTFADVCRAMDDRGIPRHQYCAVD